MDPQSSARNDTRLAWLTVIILTLFNAASYVDRQIISLMVEPIKRDLGVSDLQLGLVQGTAFALLYATFGLPLGWLVDKSSRRVVICAGASVWAIATTLSGVARTFLQLFVARVAVGAGEATLAPAAYSMLSDLFPPRQLGRALSTFQTGGIVGAAGAFLIGAGLISVANHMSEAPLPIIGHVHGWQIVFFAIGLPGLIAAPLALLLREKRGEAAAVVGEETFIHFLRRRSGYLAVHFLGFGLVIWLGYACSAWAPTVLIRKFGLSVSNAGEVLGVLLLICGVFGYYVAGQIGDRLWAKGRTDSAFRYGQVATILILLICPLAFVSGRLEIFLFGYAAEVVLVNQLGLAAAHLQIVTPKHLRGRLSALFLMVGYLVGIMFGPPSVGFATDMIFHNEARIDDALALVFAVVAPFAVLLFTIGRRVGQTAVADAAARP